MPMGLKIPVGVDQRGRAAVQKNESQNSQKILELALAEGGDDNPFQDLGLEDRLIFGIKTSAFRGKALQAVKNVAAKFVELIRIDEGTIQFNEQTEGEVELTFKYIDLLTNKEEEFRSRLRR